MTPTELVDLLNEVFLCFDSLVEKYDLEKIKTIGDCYMVASGVPRSSLDHATALVDLALDMQAAVARTQFGERELAFRIGINSGPVVAGVIGRKKFICDLWGEAVNLASRMEFAWTHSVYSDYPQHVRISQRRVLLPGNRNNRRQGRWPDGGLARAWP